MALKRFIAGATCPKCSEQDSIYIEKTDDKSFRACVSCDFLEEMRFEDKPRELDTRVYRPSQDTEVRVVNLINPDD